MKSKDNIKDFLRDYKEIFSQKSVKNYTYFIFCIIIFFLSFFSFGALSPFNIEELVEFNKRFIKFLGISFIGILVSGLITILIGTLKFMILKKNGMNIYLTYVLILDTIYFTLTFLFLNYSPNYSGWLNIFSAFLIFQAIYFLAVIGILKIISIILKWGKSDEDFTLKTIYSNVGITLIYFLIFLIVTHFTFPNLFGILSGYTGILTVIVLFFYQIIIREYKKRSKDLNEAENHLKNKEDLPINY